MFYIRQFKTFINEIAKLCRNQNEKEEEKFI